MCPNLSTVSNGIGFHYIIEIIFGGFVCVYRRERERTCILLCLAFL